MRQATESSFVDHRGLDFTPGISGPDRSVATTDIAHPNAAEEGCEEETVALRENAPSVTMFEEIVGASPALAAVRALTRKVAGSDSTVLITGETGTGKELVARAIHRGSRRSMHPIVTVNCAATPPSLIATEL